MFDKNFSEVVVRGRESLANLDEAERLMFKSFLLNTAQTASVMLLAAEGQLASWEVVKKQASKIIKDEWDNVGGRELWEQIKDDPPVVPHVAAGIENVLKGVNS